MNVEKDLSRELTTIAATVVAPPAPAAADLVRRAEHEQQRSRRTVVAAAGLVAAAVVGVVVLAGHLGDPSATPSPAPRPTATPSTLEVGEPLQTYTDERGYLYLRGTRVTGRTESDWAGAVTTRDVTTVEQGPYDTGTMAVFLGTERVAVLHGVVDHEVVVAPGARTIAWAELDAGRTHGTLVVARLSAAGLDELGRLPLDSLAAGYDDEARTALLAVDDDGTARYGNIAEGYAWTPGSRPREADVSAFTGRPAGFPRTAENVQLNPSRTWGAWTTDRTESAAGDEVLYGSLTFQRAGDPGSRRTVRAPAPYRAVTSIVWETDDAVVFSVSKVGALGVRYLRCDVTTAACEYAPLPNGTR